MRKVEGVGKGHSDEKTEIKKYKLESEKFDARVGTDVYEALAECFYDYFNSEKQHEVKIKLNDVTVTMKRRDW